MLLYCTADRVGEPSGGGVVTHQELLALHEFSEEQTRLRRDPALSNLTVYSRDNLGSDKPEPWKWDDVACSRHDFFVLQPRLAHFYSGSFPKTVDSLKRNGCKVTYAIDAHDKEVSRQEHEKLGFPFPYTHLTDSKLWQRYIDGYRRADVIICSSTVGAKIVRAYGKDFEHKDIRVIPHGCTLPEGLMTPTEHGWECIQKDKIKPLPKVFTVGYLGVYGADKGVRYLLEAWKKLNYTDGSLLVLGGKDSTSPLARHLIHHFGGGNIHLTGWQKNSSDFFNSLTVLCQPSMTEGFGIPVLEALAHGRPVICSDGAGACDLIKRDYDPPGDIFQAGNVEQLITLIESYKDFHQDPSRESIMTSAIDVASEHTWDKIRQRYKKVWEELLCR